MSPLTIYKASAGSGKTYQLTLSYLELLFQHPDSYRHILAVTFTNKAAKEMKQRVLERLYDLSLLKPGECNDDLEKLAELTGQRHEDIIQLAGNLLTRILNDYSRFSISTIDKFFQGIIRSFALELGLTPGYTVEIEQSRILSEAIDMIYANLSEDHEMKDWILQLAESRIQASKSWRYQDDIEDLSNELFKEKFQEITLLSDDVINRERINLLKKQVDDIINNSEKEIRSTAAALVTALQDKGLDGSDFLNKSRGIAGYIQKVADGAAISFTDNRRDAIFNPDKWLSKDDRSDAEKVALVSGILMPGLKKMHDFYVMWKTAENVSRHIYALGIVSDIAGNMAEFATLKNIFMISDTARFLRGLIADNPTPFIYEKTGNYINHIMLDEFQDTSVFQWENFKPLLNHTLSENNENLVVGDVKQSIYRWRNSDWKILADTVKSSFSTFDPKEKVLEVNWRSLENIVLFNNTLFAHATEHAWNLIAAEIPADHLESDSMEKLQAMFKNAYGGSVQSLPDTKIGSGGVVHAEFIEHEKDKDFKGESLEKLPGWISQLQDAGYKAGDIAIIVRYNNEGTEIAKRLMQAKKEQEYNNYNFNFISNESLFIDQHPSVKFLIGLLRYINDPFDQHNNISLLYFHRGLFKPGESADNALYPENTILSELGKEFIGLIPELKRTALFEITERLIEYFSLNKSADNLPYIQAFQEVVFSMQKKNTCSLHDFLSYWEENGPKKTITVSEQQDAITITTIHKAKGLQYKAVVMPFVGWKMIKNISGGKQNILWCDTTDTPFHAVPAVPLNYSKSLSETLFAPYYYEELVMECMDNLNLIYVGFTRAEEVLYAGLHTFNDGKSNTAGALVKRVLEYAFSNHDGDVAVQDDSEKYFTVGSLDKKEDPLSANVGHSRIAHYPVHNRKDHLRLKLKSNQYLTMKQIQDDPVAYGNLMHEIFASVDLPEDIERVVNKFKYEGVINTAQAENIHNDINSKLENSKVREWFSGKYKVINERDIIIGDKVYRPDRVMADELKAIVVDYKFGESANIHEKQVQNYMHSLHALGYEDIEGYIWYVPRNEIIKVV